jgi:hypothetical protein
MPGLAKHSPGKLEVMVMFEPTRLEPLVLQTAYGRVAPIRRKPPGRRRVARHADPDAPWEALALERDTP